MRVRVLVLLALLLAAAPAGAQENPFLVEAKEQIDGLRLEEARKSLRMALEAGSSDPETLAEIYRLLGETSAAVGDNNAARRYFRHLLAIDPHASLAPGTSPKIARPFEEAKADRQPLGDLLLQYEVHVSERPQIVLVVETDELELVRGARAVFERNGTEQVVEARGRKRIPLLLPRVEGLAVVLVALDAHGNQQQVFGSWEDPIPIEETDLPPPPGKRDEPSGPPVYARWWLYGTLGVLAAGAGTYFGLEVLKAQSDLDELNNNSMSHDFSEALRIQDRGERAALYTNISFAAAAVAGGVALWLFLSGDDGDERRSGTGAALVPVATPDGAGLTLQGRF